MELIPILSLIVLVATISTFILAVGAYVLYKIRERKGRVANAPKPDTIEAELVAPEPIMAEQRRTQAGVAPTIVRRTGYQQRANMGPAKKTSEEMRRTRTPMRPTIVEEMDPRKSESMRYTKSDEYYDQKKKFMRYTKDGYVDPAKKQKKKEDRLKWR